MVASLKILFALTHLLKFDSFTGELFLDSDSKNVPLRPALPALGRWSRADTHDLDGVGFSLGGCLLLSSFP